MSRREIGHMDIVAFARSVRGGIVGTEYLQGRAGPSSRIDGKRNEVGFWIVPLDEPAAAIGTAGVEVAVNPIAKTLGRGGVFENLLARELAPSIWANRPLGCALRNRNLIGNAVGRARTREDDLVDAA